MPAFSLTIFATNSYDISTKDWNLPGISACFLDPRYKKQIEPKMDSIIKRDALVKDISIPIKLSLYIVLIVNCSTGEFILFFFFVKKIPFL